jgi:hypothetical protein
VGRWPTTDGINEKREREKGRWAAGLYETEEILGHSEKRKRKRLMWAERDSASGLG